MKSPISAEPERRWLASRAVAFAAQRAPQIAGSRVSAQVRKRSSIYPDLKRRFFFSRAVKQFHAICVYNNWADFRTKECIK